MGDTPGFVALCLKRGMDVLLAGAGLLVLAPVLLALACWVKLDSPGPVFFRQTRVGRHGKVFRIHKFRTMAHSAASTLVGAEGQGPQGQQITVGADPRITRAGAFLRRTKLDELAQLIDVLKGDMSLVGPRPEVPKYVALYPEDVKAVVLSVRPGITDRASIEYKDESRLLAASPHPEQTYVQEVLPVKLRYAQAYVRERTLWGDVRLIWQTMAAIWSRN